MVSEAALVGPPGAVVLHAPPGIDVDLPVVHRHAHLDRKLSLGGSQCPRGSRC